MISPYEQKKKVLRGTENDKQTEDIRITLRCGFTSLSVAYSTEDILHEPKRSCFNQYSLFCFIFDIVSNYTTAILCVKTRSSVGVHV